MPNQQFYASPTDIFTWPNGAVGHRPGGPMDCLGPHAKVRNCPIAGTELRLTCYATGYADTAFSIPAATKYKNQYIGGFFTTRDDGVEFVPYDRYKRRLGIDVNGVTGAQISGVPRG